MNKEIPFQVMTMPATAMMKILLVLMSVMMLHSCTEIIYVSGDDDAGDDAGDGRGRYSVEVVTRAAGDAAGDAADAGIAYPVMLHVFDADGVAVAAGAIDRAGDAATLSLDAGDYTLVAVGSSDGYLYYDEPELDSEITIDDAPTEALMMYVDDLTVDGNATVDVELERKVARLAVEVSGVPADVTTAFLTVGPHYESITYGGEYMGNTDIEILLTKDADAATRADAGATWSSGDYYLFPSVDGGELEASLSLTGADGVTQSYDVALTADAFEANTPYSLSIAYQSGFLVNITISLLPWDDEVDVDGSAGPGVSADSGDDGSDGSGDGNGADGTADNPITVDALPTAGSAWGGFFVGAVIDADATHATLLLLAKTEADGYSSAKADGGDDAIATYLAAYSESGAAGGNGGDGNSGGDALTLGAGRWTVPTEAQADALRDALADKVTDANAALANIGGTGISTSSIDKYLCADGNKIFGYHKNGAVTDADPNTKYRLRPVATVDVVVGK